MGEPVLADPQFSKALLLRPWDGFVAAYNGQSCQRPILFTPNGQPLDRYAGDPGYVGNLVAGIQVPYGARVAIWLPTIMALNDAAAYAEPYRWQIVWRMRNVREAQPPKGQGLSWQLPADALGVPEAGADRFIVPAALQPLEYNQAEPLSINRASVNVRVEDRVVQYTAIGVPPVAPIPLPLVAAGVDGAYQQGLFSAAVAPAAAANPSYIVQELQALGNELILGMYRNPGTAPVATWQLTLGVDTIVNQLFGSTSPNTGIYIAWGSAP